MTEKIYYKDAYIKEFSASVLSCDAADGCYDVVLDKTAFFPEEGGQYSDKGCLDGARVLDVRESSGVIHHYTDAPLEVGSSVTGKLDFDERYEKMQCHTAEHILSGIIHSLFGLDNVGFHLGGEDVTMDVSAPLTRAELDKVEALANEVVYKNIPVTAEFPAKEEAAELVYRSKLDITENLRIVRIGEYDTCACCAPHVNYTGEIGAIKILDFAKLRGGIRIHIAAGRRAMRIFSELFSSALEISGLLSVPKAEISSATKKLLLDYAELKNANSAYKITAAEAEAEKLTEIDGNRVLLLPAFSSDELIAFSNIAVKKTGGILVLLSGVEGDYKYVISSDTVNLREKASEINKSLLGRGGGKPNMIQGAFAATFEKIKAYFNP